MVNAVYFILYNRPVQQSLLISIGMKGTAAGGLSSLQAAKLCPLSVLKLFQLSSLRNQSILFLSLMFASCPRYGEGHAKGMSSTWCSNQIGYGCGWSTWLIKRSALLRWPCQSGWRRSSSAAARYHKWYNQVAMIDDLETFIAWTL